MFIFNLSRSNSPLFNAIFDVPITHNFTQGILSIAENQQYSPTGVGTLILFIQANLLKFLSLKITKGELTY